MRNTGDWCGVAVNLLLLSGGGIAAADAQTTGPGGGAAAVSPATQGGFFSSLKQALSQDLDRAVVWGHYDVGSPPNTHRFYCLLDPKTGKRLPNGVAGEPFLRRDGTTGLKTPAVSPASCAEAEQEGILVTTGYAVKAPANVGSTTPPTPKTVAAAAPAVSAAPAMSSAPATFVDAQANADRAYIRQAEAEWAQSTTTRDASVLERILSDDFIGVGVDGSHYSKADAIEEYRTKPSTYTSNHLDQVEIRFYGHTAVAQGDETWTKKDGSSGKYVWTDTWVQRDGKWQVVAAEDLVPPAPALEHR
jgi:hypothetical protein